VVIPDPEPGLIRVTLTGDWTNAGLIDAAVMIESGKEKIPAHAAKGKVVEGQTIAVTVTVPPGVSELSAVLRWKEDWGRYPTADLDLIATDPMAVVFLDGATISSPERLEVPSPAAGVWTFNVDGFLVFGEAHWELIVLADGQPLKKN
jgi:hypothetical protein